ncbi:hypothetical protein [Paenibacillus sp. PastF-2]|uniref:hypothetical protein n=1 Tax=Paenibacillus sp. PastF-2 TaxID=2940532 RepID=UPI002406736F|nr:hypothetical protein [Paenibacillus sp. PastF-2]MDF9840554.1 hypothetical protein [Paenibacillus sp. PastF-2]
MSAIENVYSRETAKLLRTIPAVSMIAADQVHGSGEDQERWATLALLNSSIV